MDVVDTSDPQVMVRAVGKVVPDCIGAGEASMERERARAMRPPAVPHAARFAAALPSHNQRSTAAACPAPLPLPACLPAVHDSVDLASGGSGHGSDNAQ